MHLTTETIVSGINTLLKAGEYEFVEFILNKTHVESCGLDELLSILTVTFPAKEFLEDSRPYFYKLVEARFKKHRSLDVLKGLE
jgi:hypothetical protein